MHGRQIIVRFPADFLNTKKWASALAQGRKTQRHSICRIRCGQRQCPADKGGGDFGAVAGGVTGAVAGALIGGPIGAAVGGVAGAVAGGAAGTVIDPPEKVRTYVTCVPM